MERANVNNLLLKKVKIALTTEDMLDIFEEVGITVTKGELGALLRKEGQRIKNVEINMPGIS